MLSYYFLSFYVRIYIYVCLCDFLMVKPININFSLILMDVHAVFFFVVTVHILISRRHRIYLPDDAPGILQIIYTILSPSIHFILF